MKKIKTTREKFALIDDEDYEKVKQYRWFITGKKARYVVARINEKFIYLHHLIMGKPEKGSVIDHRNGDPYDNQKNNLRICTHSQNRGNSKKNRNGASEFKGVVIRNRRGKKRITAQIKFTAKSMYLGDFKTEVDAARAYNSAALKYFGEFAKINQI